MTNIQNALSVPIQTITSYKGKPAVYLVNGKQSEPRPVQVGMFNTKFIEIAQGLKPGDRVLLSPPFNSQEKSLEGALLTADEKAKLSTTNAAARPVVPVGEASPANGAVTTTVEPQNGVSLAEGARLRARADPSRQEMLKRFDKDGDGKLNEEELTAMRASLGNGQDGTQPRSESPRRRSREGASSQDDRRQENRTEKGPG